jgi:stage 0 sporulation regulatory protein
MIVFVNYILLPILGDSPERTSAVIKQDLITLIEKKRAELIQVAITNGLSSSVAIRHSQELDNLLNEYNRIYIKKNSYC